MQSVLSNLPVGWRFHPNNGELLDYYLKHKRLGLPIHGFDIQEVQICNFDPWDLLDNKSRNEEKYFFCRREYYLKTGRTRRKRKTGAGFWKNTGETQLITPEDSDEEIGTKRIFVYHDPDPTKWVMHEYEYTAQLNSPIKGDFVLCKLMVKNKKRSTKMKSQKIEHDSNNKKAKKKCKNIQKTRPNKKGKIGLSTRNTSSSSDIPSQNLLKIKAYNSACEYYDTPYLEFQNPNMMTAISTYEDGQLSYSNNSDFEYQNTHQNAPPISIDNKIERNSLILSDSKNSDPYKMDCVSTISSIPKNDNDPFSTNPLISSASINAESYDMDHISTYFSTPYNDPFSTTLSIASHSTYTDLREIIQSSTSFSTAYSSSPTLYDTNRSSPVILDSEKSDPYISNVNENDSSRLMASSSHNQNSNQTTAMSVYNKGKTSCLGDFGLENQNPYELNSVSMQKNIGDMNYLIDSYSDKNSIQMTANSSYENQHTSKKINTENECRMLPSDFEYQNQYENTDMSGFQDNWSFSMAYNAQETIFQEVENQHKMTDFPILKGWHCQGSLMDYDEEETAFSEVDFNYWKK